MRTSKQPEAAKTKQPEAAGMVQFVVRGNMTYNRGGLSLTLTNGALVEFSAEQAAALPDAVKQHLEPLHTVKITKPLG
jgi:hypothetical protein